MRPNSKNVCNRCVQDEALSRCIYEEGEEPSCDYCDAKSGRTIRCLPLDRLVQKIHDRVSEEYGDVHSEMISYDNEEGEYACDVYTTAEIGLEAHPKDIDGALLDLTWCKKRFGSNDFTAALASRWIGFIDFVKQDADLLSKDEPEAPDVDARPGPDALGVPYDSEEGLAPNRMLDALAEIVGRTKLTQSIQPGMVIFRARVHSSDKALTTPAELGPPPVDRATQSNRMSPIGSVRFHGESDVETAIQETFQRDREGASDKVVIIAQSKLNRSIQVLDLTELPAVPSFFGDYELHHGTRFLLDFERDFGKPIARDGSEHIEYKPTQLVTDYFRRSFKTDEYRLGRNRV
jgi:hypothetical protein